MSFYGCEGVIVGRLLLLAGASCSGKTALARRLQETLPDPWLFWEADVMQPTFPRLLEFAGRVTEEQMLNANLRSVKAYVDASFNVIAELWLWYPQALAAASVVFQGIDVAVVRLDCALGELERRESARGTTFVGTAKADWEAMPALKANLVLDSGILSTDDLSDRVARWLEKEEAGVGVA